MKGRWVKYLLMGAVVAILAACSSKPTDRGQQYKDGKFTQPFSLVNQPDAVGAPINAGDFAEQINHIRNASPRLYGNQSSIYNAVQEWLRAGGDTRNMRQFGIDAANGRCGQLRQRAVYGLLHSSYSGSPYPRGASSSILFTVCRQNVVVCRLVRRSTRGH